MPPPFVPFVRPRDYQDGIGQGETWLSNIGPNGKYGMILIRCRSPVKTHQRRFSWRTGSSRSMTRDRGRWKTYREGKRRVSDECHGRKGRKEVDGTATAMLVFGRNLPQSREDGLDISGLSQCYAYRTCPLN